GQREAGQDGEKPAGGTRHGGTYLDG
ncbi:MAG: hypothetical protein QOD39_67, partial [Mycobacterium sp.]|nr:hypothetical protein [Mycobacterium sp.]